MSKFGTSKVRSAVKKGVAGAALAIGVLVAVAGPAGASSPAPVAGAYTGNKCSSARWYVDNAGAEACVFQNGFAPNSYISITPAAYDYAKDGLSPKTDVIVQQWSPSKNAWVSTNQLASVINTTGYGTTKVASATKIVRQSGMTYLRIWIRACTYDTSTGVHKSCGSQYTNNYAWAG